MENSHFVKLVFAKDYEVVWEADTNLLFCDPAFGPADGLNYTHNFYSCFTLEELQTIGFFKNKLIRLVVYI